MPSRREIVAFHDDEPPPGSSPWVVDGPTGDVSVVEPDPDWPQWYQIVAERIRDALGWRVLDLNHVGSTAVPGLPSKPIIDIDLTVADPSDEESYVPALEAVGFELRVREPWWFEHRMLRATDIRCNLHVFGYDSPELIKHRIFRDWLRGNPDEAAFYASVKQDAATASNAAGEDVGEYNRRKQDAVHAIYNRAFRAMGLLPD